MADFEWVMFDQEDIETWPDYEVPVIIEITDFDSFCYFVACLEHDSHSSVDYFCKNCNCGYQPNNLSDNRFHVDLKYVIRWKYVGL